MSFQVESIVFCPNGIAPRWLWWIHGIAQTKRYGMVGTDENGLGLYLYNYQGDLTPEKTRLLDKKHFYLSSNASKEDATERLVEALEDLGWAPAKQNRPSRHKRSA